MTESELAAALAPMVAIVGKPMTQEQIKAWHLMLDDLDVDTVRRGVVATMRDYQYAGFPPVGVVRKNCGAMSGNITATDRVTIAWTAVKAAVATQGGYATVTFDDPITNATIRALGGWVRICDTESGEQFDVWLRKEFERTYTALLTAGVQHDQAAPLAGLCDIANGATGHDERQTPRAIETGLPAPAKHLVRGGSLGKILTIHSEVKRLAGPIGGLVRSLDLPDEDERPTPLTADEQRRQLAEWQTKRLATKPERK